MMVWFASQYEGDEIAVGGLAGSISIDQSVRSFRAGLSRDGLTLVDVPEALQARMSHYISSVAVAGDHAIFTSSKGGVVFQVQRSTGRIDQTLSIMDCSGIAAQSMTELDGALITSGTGEVLHIDGDDMVSLAMHTLQWDNHCYSI